MISDRLGDAWDALVHSALPHVDYLALYAARVVVFDKDHQTIDVRPDDPRLPGMGGIAFRHGLPGAVVDVAKGTTVLVGWADGDPSKPYACLWGGGEAVASLTLNALRLNLGGEEGAEPVPKGLSLNAALSGFSAALATYAEAIQGTADTSPGHAVTTAFTGAISALTSALSAALSTTTNVR